ncbi:MAG: hypothetical protein SXG53_00710 [Pseudomonadota bacterium]|nr:hypothetical protein [Pseudomonadota bacterium]
MHRTQRVPAAIRPGNTGTDTLRVGLGGWCVAGGQEDTIMEFVSDLARTQRR